MELLEVTDLSISFGGLKAVQNVSFSVPKGKIVSVIGPNGAGKTTIFNMLTGFYIPDTGSIRLDGVEMNGKKAYEFIEYGIARTFQNIRLYGQLSVLENVLIGYQCRLKQSLWDAIFHTKTLKKTETEVLERARRALEEIHLLPYEKEMCSNLPYGKQKVLEIARALMSEPKLLFLDEPAAGLNPQETQELSSYILELAKKGFTIVLIEHDLRLVMGISDYVYVIDHGIKIAEGIPSEVQHNPEVITAYIGKGGERQNVAGNLPAEHIL